MFDKFEELDFEIRIIKECIRVLDQGLEIINANKESLNISIRECKLILKTSIIGTYKIITLMNQKNGDRSKLSNDSLQSHQSHLT